MKYLPQTCSGELVLTCVIVVTCFCASLGVCSCTAWCPHILCPQVERPSRKRCDSFGMLDGVEEDRSSCSSESSGEDSPEDSDEEELGGGGGSGMMQLSPPSSLTLIKTNGQVYTYPDGKAGMGQSLLLLLSTKWKRQNVLIHHGK